MGSPVRASRDGQINLREAWANEHRILNKPANTPQRTESLLDFGSSWAVVRPNLYVNVPRRDIDVLITWAMQCMINVPGSGTEYSLDT